MSTNLFNKKILAGKKSSVFVDVAQNEKGTTWLKVAQSKLQEDGSWKSESVFFFPDQLDEFRNALAEAEQAIPHKEGGKDVPF